MQGKPGRPKVSKKYGARYHQVNMRLSDEEYAALVALADVKNQSISEFARNLLDWAITGHYVAQQGQDPEPVLQEMAPSLTDAVVSSATSETIQTKVSV